VSRSDAREIISGGLAAVVPSAWEETFGLVAVEAMASGTAPVAPATGSFPELVQDGVDGVLFHEGATGLAETFARMDRDPATFMELGVAAEHTYRARFMPKGNVDQLLSIYEYAVAHPRTAP
jgi:glycosyltransferase involved in cell wall biosynthesis